MVNSLKLDWTNYVEVSFKKFDSVGHLSKMREFIGGRPLYYNDDLLRRMRVRKTKVGKHVWFTYQDKGVGNSFRITRCSPFVQLTLYRNVDNELDEVVVLTSVEPNFKENSGIFIKVLQEEANELNSIYRDADYTSKKLLDSFFSNILNNYAMSDMYFRTFMTYVKVDEDVKKSMRDLRNYFKCNRHRLSDTKLRELLEK